MSHDLSSKQFEKFVTDMRSELRSLKEYDTLTKESLYIKLVKTSHLLNYILNHLPEIYDKNEKMDCLLNAIQKFINSTYDYMLKIYDHNERKPKTEKEYKVIFWLTYSIYDVDELLDKMMIHQGERVKSYKNETDSVDIDTFISTLYIDSIRDNVSCEIYENLSDEEDMNCSL